MAQNKLFDPIVASGPSLTGVGNGTISIDRLTHFTITQTYTATCIAKTPDTLFSIAGSLDGPVGIATVGTQFFDGDLKVFLTITQGSTAFEVGDQFTFGVEHGTDLNQDNIDDYDELVQKNFGQGIKGTLSGDHNLRYNNDAQFARLRLQELLFAAVESGADGNDIQVAYLNPTPAVAADLLEQDLTFTARTPGVAGNAITIEYLNMILAVAAFVEIQDLTFTAQDVGSAGNGISIAYTTGATAGSEVVSVVGLAISVQIQSGVSTAQQIIDAIEADMDASALVSVAISGSNVAQTAPVSATFLEDGSDDIGDAGNEVVQVVGNDITVTLENGVSTADQVKAAIEASLDASALIDVEVSGTGSDPQTAPVTVQSLTGGLDGVGQSGFEAVQVTGNLIEVTFDPGVSTAQTIYDLLTGESDVTDLVDVELIGDTGAPQFGPVSATNLSGGLNKNFEFNHNEITEDDDFVDGNASVKLNDLEALGNANIAKHLQANTLGLNDDSGDSGLAISNMQQFVNRLRSLNKLTIQTADGSKVLWTGGALQLSDDLLFKFRESAIVNTLPENVFSLSDGQSLFVYLNPDATQDVVSVVAASRTPVTAFRLGTRIGSTFHWFNGVVTKDGEQVDVGSQADYAKQILMTVSGGGLLSHDDTTAGLITWPSDIKVRPLGTSVVLTILASNITLSDGQVAYIPLASPLVTANVALVAAPLTQANLNRTDKFWLFYRSGTRVYFRNGAAIDQNEVSRLQDAGSTAENQNNSIMRRDGSGNFAAQNATLNKAIVAPGTGNGVDVSTAGDMDIGASVGANDLNLGGATSRVIVKGDFEVQGTETILNTQTLEVEDTNIVINNGGTDGSAEGAGITVERTGTAGSMAYQDSLASKWKAGALGSEIELVNVSSVQTLTNKILQILALGTADDTASGSNATLSTISASQTRLTNGSLVSLDAIPAPSVVDLIVIHNVTGNSILVNNETGGTAANRILTGTGANLTLANNATLIMLYDLTSSRWRVVGGSGTITLGAFGSTPNSSGASLSGSQLTLQPADATNPGGLSTTTQNIGGFKSFQAAVQVIGALYFNRQDNSSATGANAVLTAASSVLYNVTNGSLSSVNEIVRDTVGPQFMVLTNLTGNSVLINNETGSTAVNRILTGTGSNLTLANNASIILIYNLNTQRWYVVGGSGGGGVSRTVTGTFGSPTAITAGGGITAIAAVDQDIYVNTASGEVNVTANPQISAGTVDGQVMKIIGTSDVNYPLFETGNGLWLNGDWAAHANATLVLRWSSSQSLWVEQSRNF